MWLENIFLSGYLDDAEHIQYIEIPGQEVLFPPQSRSPFCGIG